MNIRLDEFKSEEIR